MACRSAMRANRHCCEPTRPMACCTTPQSQALIHSLENISDEDRRSCRHCFAGSCPNQLFQVIELAKLCVFISHPNFQPASCSFFQPGYQQDASRVRLKSLILNVASPTIGPGLHYLILPGKFCYTERLSIDIPN